VFDAGGFHDLQVSCWIFHRLPIYRMWGDGAEMGTSGSFCECCFPGLRAYSRHRRSRSLL
jgi:hypothetical protein